MLMQVIKGLNKACGGHFTFRLRWLKWWLIVEYWLNMASSKYIEKREWLG